MPCLRPCGGSNCSPHAACSPAWVLPISLSATASWPLANRGRPRPFRTSIQAANDGQAGASSKEAMLARIAAAKQYKQTGGVVPAPSSMQQPSSNAPSSNSSSITPPTPEPSPSASVSEQDLSVQPMQPPPQQSPTPEQLQELQQQQQQQQQPGPYSAFLAQIAATDPNEIDTPGPRQPTGRSDVFTSPDAPDTAQLLSSTPTRRDGGSAYQAADWLKGVMEAQQLEGLSPGMRAEEFTAAKEQRTKSMGAEIITADTSYRPEGESMEKYKPKVSTWGMFPRPNNISVAYGGGRTIRPGQELETVEQKAKREAEFAATMQQYRVKMGLGEVMPEEEKAAQVMYDAAMKQFKAGRLKDAYDQFQKVNEIMPLRSRLGGLATLQAAVCLDSTGSGKQAEALYRKLRGHPTSEVSKKAKQLVFGFQAQTFLKADTISYAVDKKAWDPFFRRFADASRVYVPTDEERARDAQQAQLSAAIAAVIVLGPIALVAALAAQP